MENFIGQIIMMATNYVPRGYLPCDGRLIPIQQNTALFSLLGTMYGGDGRTDFGLPNLKGRIPVQSDSASKINTLVTNGHGEDKFIQTTEVIYCICVEGIYPSKD
ncbi:MAG: tail fiber protein [Spirochaetia bacterium]|nr:tail fiber protein [Spirochaetia bacterium]